MTPLSRAWPCLCALLLLGCGRFGYDASPLTDECDIDGDSCQLQDRVGVCVAGSCCTGCVEAGECVRGRGADACGSGGGACSVCDSESFCERAECVRGADSRRFALGYQFGCAIVDGGLYCWGSNAGGKLGTGDGLNQLSPARVGTADDWTSIAAGQQYACGIRHPGELYCWGRGAEGGLLQGDFDARPVPTRVAMASDWVEVDIGHEYTCARNGAGELFCGGYNFEGQLGQGFRSPLQDIGIPSLTQVGASADWTAVRCGRGHGCGLVESGAVVCWGANNESQQGHPDGGDDPTPLPDVGPWTALTAGSESTCAYKGDELLCWGENLEGLLGNGSTDTLMTPEFITDDVRAWSMHLFHACGIRNSGALVCAGRSIEGQLGIDDADPQLQLIEPIIGGTDWVEIATGRFTSCARRRDGSIYCTGANGDGQLGLGDTMSRDGFELITLPLP